ncbi:transcriptional repressor NrdR [Candidatus Woesearchaeota archaeon]|nr:transcriptional repressor NrdR [Candidatus Woesearchaeota archaeon]
MRCPFCKRDETRVLESRQTEGSLRRRRECKKCSRRFTTYERQEATNFLVVKSNSARQLFSREKLRRGILRACEKRPVSVDQIEKSLDKIEEQIKKRKSGEVSSKVLGELVMKQLKRLDKVAYIRFASVYLDFKDPEDFKDALREVLRRR